MKAPASAPGLMMDEEEQLRNGRREGGTEGTQHISAQSEGQFGLLQILHDTADTKTLGMQLIYV